MISLLQLSKIIKFIIFLTFLITNSTFLIAAEDIWKKKENEKTETKENNNQEKIKIKSPIKSNEIEKITLTIDEQQIDKFEQEVIGIYDPEKIRVSISYIAKVCSEDNTSSPGFR